MIKEHLFISDVHLGAFDENTEALLQTDLLALIEYSIENSAQIYILGDLFDYWMEFPNSDFKPEIGKETLKAFQKYNREVMPAIYITGNHDNWTLGHFVELGFDIETEFRVVEIYGQKIFLMHGDGHYQLNGQLKRPIMHRLLRNNLFLFFYRSLLPKNVALFLMQQFSNSSRKIDRKDPNVLNKNAELILDSAISEIVITGHDHIPRLETFNSGLYINLGTFFHHRTLVRGIDGVLSLVQWNAQQQTFNEYLDIT